MLRKTVGHGGQMDFAIENSARFARQLGRGERLADERFVKITHINAARKDILRISGHIENLEFGPYFLQLLSKFASAYRGHYNVRKQKMNLTLEFSNAPQCFPG